MKVEITTHQLQRFLCLIPEDWKPCFNFRQFVKALAPTDKLEFSLENGFATLKLCSDPTRACIVYDSKRLLELEIKDKIFFTIEDSVQLNGFTSETLVQLRRTQSTNVPAFDFINKHDSIKDWETIVFQLWPTLGFNYFKSVFERIWRNKTYYCVRDNLGIKQLMIWDVNEDYYDGYVLWSRDNCGDLSKVFMRLHQHLASKQIKNFYAYCNPQNKTSWNIHQLMGYKMTGHKIMVYRPI